MTRKHYKALATVIRGFENDMAPEAFMQLIWQIGEVLEADNERFDMVRWEDACGLTRELIEKSLVSS